MLSIIFLSVVRIELESLVAYVAFIFRFVTERLCIAKSVSALLFIGDKEDAALYSASLILFGCKACKFILDFGAEF